MCKLKLTPLVYMNEGGEPNQTEQVLWGQNLSVLLGPGGRVDWIHFL